LSAKKISGAKGSAGEGGEGVKKGGGGGEFGGCAVEQGVPAEGEQSARVVGVDEDGLAEVEGQGAAAGAGQLVELGVVAVEPGAPEQQIGEEGVEGGGRGVEVIADEGGGEALEKGDEGGLMGAGVEPVLEGVAGGAALAIGGGGAAGQAAIAAGGFGFTGRGDAHGWLLGEGGTGRAGVGRGFGGGVEIKGKRVPIFL
jgi:hypothetical protein